VTERIFVVLYASNMGLTCCYKTTTFYIYIFQQGSAVAEKLVWRAATRRTCCKQI